MFNMFRPKTTKPEVIQPAVVDVTPATVAPPTEEAVEKAARAENCAAKINAVLVEANCVMYAVGSFAGDKIQTNVQIIAK